MSEKSGCKGQLDLGAGGEPFLEGGEESGQ
jgi:hypothetical protein